MFSKKRKQKTIKEHLSTKSPSKLPIQVGSERLFTDFLKQSQKQGKNKKETQENS